MSDVTISIPPGLEQFVDEQLRTKGCGSVSEYVTGLIQEAQLQQQHDARLEQLLMESLSSEGEDLPWTR